MEDYTHKKLMKCQAQMAKLCAKKAFKETIQTIMYLDAIEEGKLRDEFTKRLEREFQEFVKEE